MGINLFGRNFLTLKDYSAEEINYLIDLSAQVKKEKLDGIYKKRLENKNIALIFEKPSTRTRCAFVVASYDEGAHPEYLGKNDIQLGKKESVKDTARVLGRMFDGIQFRGFKHSTVEGLAEFAGVPVWNGLTDKFHPTQILADFLTVKEQKGKVKGVKFVYVGDGRNNMANSLLVGATKVGMDFRILSPKELFPEQSIIDYGNEIALQTGAKITVTENHDKALLDADVIYTDVWVSMGEEDQYAERIALLKPYQVNMSMIKKATSNVTFLHCLPAFHNRETIVGEEMYQNHNIDAMEVTEEVFESPHSKAFDQAENRMHTIKAVMIATLNKNIS